MHNLLQESMIISQMQNLKFTWLALMRLLFLGAAAWLFLWRRKIGSSSNWLLFLYNAQPAKLRTSLYLLLIIIWASAENSFFIYVLINYIFFILWTLWLIPILNDPASISTRQFSRVIHCSKDHLYGQQFNLYNQYSSLESTSNRPYKIQDVRCEEPTLGTQDKRLSIDKTPNIILKRCFDLLVALVVLLFILSWLTPLLTLIIKLDSRGPVFFVQLRSGKHAIPFKCYKFRSMYVNDTADLVQAHKNDQRLTPIGLFLRRTSIDELPQFWNVLRGEMSVIGPRPHMLLHTKSYQQLLSNYRDRLSIKPGITGWAQVNNCRGETKQLKQMAQRVSHDLFYLKNWSLSFDLQIAVKTVRILLSKQQDTY